jgi:hypothetical protein
MSLRPIQTRIFLCCAILAAYNSTFGSVAFAQSLITPASPDEKAGAPAYATLVQAGYGNSPASDTTAEIAVPDTLVAAPSAGGAYYGMYCITCVGASFTLNSSYYVSTIEVVLRFCDFLLLTTGFSVCPRQNDRR